MVSKSESYWSLRKAQVAIEYFIIIAIIIAFLIPIWAYVGGIRTQTNTQLMLSYAKNAVDRISDMAELVYSQGPPAKMEIKVYIPGGVEYVNITNGSINLGIRTQAGISDVFAVSTAAMNGTLPVTEGIHWITIEAEQGLVQIRPTN